MTTGEGTHRFVASTEGIAVAVTPVFLEEQSKPKDGQFVWAYHVEISNQSSRTVQLLTRYWHITDAHGQVQEVRGDGVVGAQPILEPGESFAYTSGCPLGTPSGVMVGSYGMVTEDGAAVEVAIPAFSLDSPYDHAVRH